MLNYAILIALRWIKEQQTPRNKTQVHFFIDSQTAIQNICSKTLPKTHFFLCQDIKHIAVPLSEKYEMITHWIPSHLDKESFGQYRIIGNEIADRLAKQGRRESARGNTGETNINTARKAIMTRTADLLWQIKQKFNSDGPSSDDFSNANAAQIIAETDGLR